MSNRPLHVCFVAPLPPPKRSDKSQSCGGIAHWTKMIYDYSVNRDDIQISIIDTLPWWRSINKLPVWKRIFGGGFQLLFHLSKLCLLLSAKRIDVIHLTTSGQFGIARDISVLLVAKIFKIPVIYHIRFGRIHQIAKIKNLEWQMISYVIKNAHTVIAIDLTTKETINKHLPTVNIKLIPNCINISNLPTPNIFEALPKIALFAGWAIPSKGITELVEAWSQLKCQEWELHIVGPIEKSYKQALIKQYQPKDIKFLEEIPHNKTIQLMAECDLFVFPSYTEGFPNAVLEAMALGKAIIATNVGAIPEMLDRGCGELIQPKNIQSLKMALQLLFNNNNLRTEMGKLANKKVLENYSIDIIFANYMKAWNQAAVAFDR